MKRQGIVVHSCSIISGLAIASVFITSPPDQTAHASGGLQPLEYITLNGTVRDFNERTAENGHPDFERQPDAGFGHYAGNIALETDADGKPVFVGGGSKVFSQAVSADGRSIAPHLANACIEVVASPGSDCVVLADSRGNDALQVCFEGVVYNDDGTSSWTYSVLELEGGKDLSHWNVSLDRSHGVMDGTTAGYALGVDGSTGHYGIKWDVTDSFTAGTFVIVLDDAYSGDADGYVVAKAGSQEDTATLFTPSADLVGEGAPFGASTSLAPVIRGDRSASLGASDHGGIDSAASFTQWFRDVPGVNQSTPVSIQLNYQADTDTYVFDSARDPYYSVVGGFFPINGKLLGNSAGNDKNFHFTYELDTTFTYKAGTGQVFTFRGDDDVWVFIDGKLVIDIGGVHSAIEQSVEIDNLCWLEDDQDYRFQFFFAERHRTQSNFRIETNLKLKNGATPSITAMFD